MVTVVVAEDEPHIRSIVRVALERSGYAVLEATNGSEALALVETHSVDVVVADVVMPRMGGRELVWRLSQATPPIPVILMSGMLAPDHVDKDVSPAAYVAKPFGPSDIVGAVARVLRRP
jgi:CheY-like chemotaxis protein